MTVFALSNLTRRWRLTELCDLLQLSSQRASPETPIFDPRFEFFIVLEIENPSKHAIGGHTVCL
jgi:hypothetical protein